MKKIIAITFATALLALSFHSNAQVKSTKTKTTPQPALDRSIKPLPARLPKSILENMKVSSSKTD